MLGLILLVACSEKESIPFKEKGNWRASYEITESNLSYTIFFCGKEKVLKRLTTLFPIIIGVEIRIKNYRINEDDLIQSTTPDNNGDHLHQVEESITVSISWDDKEEELILPRKTDF